MKAPPKKPPKRKRRGDPGGRPPKLTPELQADIVGLVQAGNYLETAAHLAGVNVSTVRMWLRQGAQAKSPDKYTRFLAVVRKAEAYAEAHGVQRVRAHGATHWQAEAWFLERRYRDRWGRSDNEGGEVRQDVEQFRAALSNTEARRVLDEAAARLALALEPSEPCDDA